MAGTCEIQEMPSYSKTRLDVENYEASCRAQKGQGRWTMPRLKTQSEIHVGLSTHTTDALSQVLQQVLYRRDGVAWCCHKLCRIKMSLSMGNSHAGCRALSWSHPGDMRTAPKRDERRDSPVDNIGCSVRWCGLPVVFPPSYRGSCWETYSSKSCSSSSTVHSGSEAQTRQVSC